MSWTDLEVAGWLLAGTCLVLGSARFALLRSKMAALQAFSKSLLDAQEKERKRIAADLHGSVGQNLMVIKNRAQLGMAAVATESEAAGQLRAISEVCTSTIDQARRIAHDLGPRHLQQIGLTEAVDAMIDRVAGSTGIRFDRKLEQVDDLFKGEAAINIYRIVQEALNNVMKHARASVAKVELLRDVSHVEVKVCDDGCGFESDTNHRGRCLNGLGLAEIGERARILGGRLDVRSERGQGTTLCVSIPVAT